MDTMAPRSGRPGAAEDAGCGRLTKGRGWSQHRKSGNFIAGILFGTSLWVPIFVLTADDMETWARTGAFGAIGLLAAACIVKTVSKSPASVREPDLSPVRCAVFKNAVPQRKAHNPGDDQRSFTGD